MPSPISWPLEELLAFAEQGYSVIVTAHIWKGCMAKSGVRNEELGTALLLDREAEIAENRNNQSIIASPGEPGGGRIVEKKSREELWKKRHRWIRRNIDIQTTQQIVPWSPSIRIS